MNQDHHNLFNYIPNLAIGEDFQEILQCRNVKIERIVSSSKIESIIYNQQQDEWVLLLQGKAILALNNQQINLHTGDYIFIPSHTSHQIIQISSQPCCIWLAIHIY